MPCSSTFPDPGRADEGEHHVGYPVPVDVAQRPLRVRVGAELVQRRLRVQRVLLVPARPTQDVDLDVARLPVAVEHADEVAAARRVADQERPERAAAERRRDVGERGAVGAARRQHLQLDPAARRVRVLDEVQVARLVARVRGHAHLEVGRRDGGQPGGDRGELRLEAGALRQDVDLDPAEEVPASWIAQRSPDASPAYGASTNCHWLGSDTVRGVAMVPVACCHPSSARALRIWTTPALDTDTSPTSRTELSTVGQLGVPRPLARSYPALAAYSPLVPSRTSKKPRSA